MDNTHFYIINVLLEAQRIFYSVDLPLNHILTNNGATKII